MADRRMRSSDIGLHTRSAYALAPLWLLSCVSARTAGPLPPILLLTLAAQLRSVWPSTAIALSSGFTPPAVYILLTRCHLPGATPPHQFGGI